MNLSQIKKYIQSIVGEEHLFLYRGIRNQNEKFEGCITKTFPSVFIIELENGKILCFSYNDFIVKNIKILY